MSQSSNIIVLPSEYEGLGTLQDQFDRYQRAGFPQREANFFSLELCGEAGELANLEKKLWKGQSIPPHDLADEAADVLIALLNYVNSRHIDLAAAVEAKMRKIEEKRSTVGH